MNDTITIIGFVQSIFGILLFLVKKPMHLSFKILIIWLLVNLIFLGAQLLPFEVVDYFKPGIFPILLLFGPLLYFYVASLVIPDFKPKSKHLLHLIPLLAVSLHRTFTDAVSVSNFEQLSDNSAYFFNKIYYLLVVISLFIYWVFSIRLILNHRKIIPFYFSNYTRKNTLSWLIFVVLLFLFLFVADFFMSSLIRLFNVEFFSNLSISTNLTIFTFIILFFGINQTVIFKKEELVANNEKPEEQGKYKRSSLKEEQIEEINQKVSSYLTTKKPYLNTEFSFQMMVEDLGISRHILSQVINAGQNKNFYQLINEFRVKEVKEKLNDQKYKNLTILGVAFECGFNSKTTFNRIFKDETGMTPSNYIKNLNM